ncbi:hypothetical protein N7520_006417 [Penicillium odoratum]|uniref:uncharacterized protein n=1 Tax=Penicillium odoratum TaxID=1167516 RepID=UPI00254783E4|nr:uncharacterized protein N7520_006417 [Penicillium odoratum]KAJ5759261.1 hypothetical protein N7520_006417 [Penicillium odoratum]
MIHVGKLLDLIQALEEPQSQGGNTTEGKILSWPDTAWPKLITKQARNVFLDEILMKPLGVFGKKKSRGGNHKALPALENICIDDPRCGEIEDMSSPSILQLNKAGFSTKNNCLRFDHLARRDISRHCKEMYPEDLFDIHEKFTFALRAAMKAKVEICWGANFRQRMFKKLDLEPLRLWGDFAGLTFAIRNAWKGQAAAQLKEVFPEAILSTEQSHRIRVTNEDQATFQRVFGLVIKLEPSQIAETLNTLPATNDKIRRNPGLQMIAEYWHGLEKLSCAFISILGAKAHSLRANDLQAINCFSGDLPAEFEESDCWDWEDLPIPLVEFIQAQDGLKFNKRKIMCRADLENAYHLLQRCEGNLKILDILTLAFAVLGAYGWMIARPRKHLVDDMLILREPPHDVIARKCSGCNKEHLDDPFAYWSKLDTDCYVLWYYFRSNCGRPECTTKGVDLLPLDSQIRYSRSTQNALKAKPVDRFDKWFLLCPGEYGALPSKLQVMCQGEDCQETISKITMVRS